MNFTSLLDQIKQKKSFLCVGLDSDITKIPKCLLTHPTPVFEFNKMIIDATHDLTVAYKLNMAFYECRGVQGWNDLERTVNYIHENYPDIFIIADAKRGDIGNTSEMYAKAFFEKLPCDAITVAPYMGSDSVVPFLGYPDKWVILLALTSNEGAYDFQFLKNQQGDTLYETVLNRSKDWGNKENMMYVVGGTKATMLEGIRKIVPDHFLLIPGVGTQGGSLEEVARNGMNSTCGLLVNSSRAIIFADSSETFAGTARTEAEKLQKTMEALLLTHGVIT